MSCRFPTCTRHPEPNGMCVFHQIYANGVSVKADKPIAKESEKEKKLKRSRTKRYKIFLAAHPLCEAKFSKRCTKVADTVHHTKGRTPAIVDNEEFWKASCSTCNLEIEARHADAEEQGLKIPRHQIQS